MEIALLYFDGCPNWQLAAERLDSVAAGSDALTVRHRRVETEEDAIRHGFRGSPSVQLDGVDLFPDPTAPVGLACRRYPTPTGLQGAPTIEQLHQAIATTAIRKG